MCSMKKTATLSRTELEKIIRDSMPETEPFLVMMYPGCYRIGTEKNGYCYTGEGGKNEFLKALREEALNYNYEEKGKSNSNPLFGQSGE